jgi:hypothetical protein
MRRREVVALIAAGWAGPMRAQTPERVRHIGVLVSAPANDAEYPTLLNAFRQSSRS